MRMLFYFDDFKYATQYMDLAILEYVFPWLLKYLVALIFLIFYNLRVLILYP